MAMSNKTTVIRVTSDADKRRLEAMRKLLGEYGKMERDIWTQNAILRENNVGMDDPLVDAEGCPRNDIDVQKVGDARNLLTSMKDDRKVVTGKLERYLYELFDRDGCRCEVIIEGLKNTKPVEDESGSNESQAENAVTNDDGQCFAEVGVVQVGSPANLAGLMENDLLLQFGSINRDNYTEITQIQDIVKNSMEQPIQVRVKRGQQDVDVTLVPRPWGQPDLLGCEIRKPSSQV